MLQLWSHNFEYLDDFAIHRQVVRESKLPKIDDSDDDDGSSDGKSNNLLCSNNGHTFADLNDFRLSRKVPKRRRDMSEGNSSKHIVPKKFTMYINRSVQ